MNKSTLYYIWLTLGVGFCNTKIKYINSLYKDITMLYEGGEQEMRLCGVFSESDINRLKKHNLTEAQQILDKCQEYGYSVYDISMEEYPDCLREIPDAPAVLYVKGQLPDFNLFDSVAIIGTRRATVYGIKTAMNLGVNLSKQGFIVVSGGALGIDCAAHRGVLQAKGTPVCVLGCGIDYNYLQENKEMREMVSKCGALVSEYPPGHPPASQNFPQRNRIISAFSKGIIVVEAPKKSGSMITVDYAIKQNKDVFAVMGNVDSPYSSGSNQLIKDGAIPTTSWQDVVEYYRGVNDFSQGETVAKEEIISVPTKNKNTSAHSVNTPVPVHRNIPELSEEEKKVYFTIGNEPVHVDYIAEKTGLPPFVITRVVSSLEIREIIVNTSGRYFALK